MIESLEAFCERLGLEAEALCNQERFRLLKRLHDLMQTARASHTRRDMDAEAAFEHLAPREFVCLDETHRSVAYLFRGPAPVPFHDVYGFLRQDETKAYADCDVWLAAPDASWAVQFNFHLTESHGAGGPWWYERPAPQ